MNLKCCDILLKLLSNSISVGLIHKNFPGQAFKIPHINKIHKIKSAHKDYLDMSVICKGPRTVAIENQNISIYLI